jgi:hypothetical protein
MIRGGLVTKDFLVEGIAATDAWKRLDDLAGSGLEAELRRLVASVAKMRKPTEPDTESKLIWPVLGALGWADTLIQQNLSARGRQDVPDVLLFGDTETMDRATKLDAYKRYALGLCVVESKRWGRPLDREDRGTEAGVPSTQMLRYLRRVDDLAGGKLRWGILTNGRLWRLYWQGAPSVAEDFFEVDLAKALGVEPVDLVDMEAVGGGGPDAARARALRLFVLFFGRGAFLPDNAGRTFHDLALAEGKFWEERVAKDLSDVVFHHVFPDLSNAIARADPKRDPGLCPAYLEEVRQGALVLLYRILFVLYAEDRNLLPDESGPYAEVAVTRLRLELCERLTSNRPYPSSMATIWSRLEGIFRAIAKGDDELGIPPYNGGLFDGDTAPVLERVRIPDSVMAGVLFKLSHLDGGQAGRAPRYINYRDLSVQQLGSVYERILEHGLRARPDGTVEVAVDPGARKGSGSYYTPEDLVTLVIERTVGPLVEERVEAFRARALALETDPRPVGERLAELAPLDPAMALLRLKVCDPAMGSGHFLVSLVDWLADRVLGAMAEAFVCGAWGGYESPVGAHIAGIREEIRATAARHGWPLRDGQLDDRHIIRRMVLKRVVHGVDKNPMAVELAKVALWLHSFTVGAPLSFLDHHLRCGDSVVGAWVDPTMGELRRRGVLFMQDLERRLGDAAAGMVQVEALNDSDLGEVAKSEEAFGQVEAATTPVAAFFSLVTAERVMGLFDSAPRRPPPAVEDLVKAKAPARVVERAREQAAAFDRAAAWQMLLEGTFGDPARIAAGLEPVVAPGATGQAGLFGEEPPAQAGLFREMGDNDRRRLLADRLVAEARALAGRHGFLHWEAAFPNVWGAGPDGQRAGGFDAVVGNPPYVRQELLGETKSALRPRAEDGPLDPPSLAPRPGYLTYDGAADLYVYFYEQGLRLLKPGGRMGYVVTNKWLKAGYAEALRDFFSKAAWVEFIADFGHAKHFFPDADVFPSVLVVRRPVPVEPPRLTEVCVIPREVVPSNGLSGAVAAATYKAPRASLNRESWTLEPPAVVELMEKMRRRGAPLAEYGGLRSYRGILTGLNEAFVIDTTTRERLVAEDPGCAEIIKPLLRGQDVDRWATLWQETWIIFARRGIEIDRYPSVKRHLEGFRQRLEPRPAGWVGEDWPGRKEGRYAWYEIQDSVDFWPLYEGKKIMYQEIQFSPCYAMVGAGMYGNNKTFIIPTDDVSVLAALNSPALWWFNWRHLPHMKDEALSPMGFKMETVPIVALGDGLEEGARLVEEIASKTEAVAAADRTVTDWLAAEFGVAKPGRALSAPHAMATDLFVEAVRACLPKKRRLTAGDVAELRREHMATSVPAREAASRVLQVERRLSDLVNAAYGLTPEDVKLMWETAPPRMPIDPASELGRLELGRSAPEMAAI